MSWDEHQIYFQFPLDSKKILPKIVTRCKWCLFSRWSSKLKRLWRHCLWQSLMQLYFTPLAFTVAVYLIASHFSQWLTFRSILSLQRCHSWRHRHRRRVPTTQQDREVQRPQSDKGCWSQEAVPEVLEETEQKCFCCHLVSLSNKRKSCSKLPFLLFVL